VIIGSFPPLDREEYFNLDSTHIMGNVVEGALPPTVHRKLAKIVVIGIIGLGILLTSILVEREIINEKLHSRTKSYIESLQSNPYTSPPLTGRFFSGWVFLVKWAIIAWVLSIIIVGSIVGRNHLMPI
jgi:hypothetical protein